MLLCCSYLELEIDGPSRWILGEGAHVEVTLRNTSDREVSIDEIKACWPGQHQSESQTLRLSPMEQCALGFQLKASSLDQSLLTFQIQARWGGVLSEMLESNGMRMEIRGRAGPARASMCQSGVSEDLDSLEASQTAEDSKGVMRQTISVVAIDNAVVNLSAQSLENWRALDPMPHTRRRAVLGVLKSGGMDSSWAGMRFKAVTPGDFPRQRDDGDVQEVSLTQAFWFARDLVPQKLYQKFRPLPCELEESYRHDDNPMIELTWFEAVEFCQWLTAEARRENQLPPGFVFRLPTEAEWEYVCRAGDRDLRCPCGGVSRQSLERFDEAAFTPEARSIPAANNWQVNHLLGYVNQWCLDMATDDPPANSVDPFRAFQAGGSELRVIRGGFYRDPAEVVHCGARGAESAGARSSRIGLRVVLARPVW